MGYSWYAGDQVSKVRPSAGVNEKRLDMILWGLYYKAEQSKGDKQRITRIGG